MDASTLDMTAFTNYVETHTARMLDEYCDLLRIPSVSAQRRGQHEAVAWLTQRLERLGAQVQHKQVDGGAPLIYATLGAAPESGARRLLIYDHYDVQPEEPVELWHSPAFEPSIRDGVLYARGASDNKGNLMARIHALEAWQETIGALPLSIALLIEGEEEIGSVTLPAFCREHPDLLRADGCLWETGGVENSRRPVITCGAKGMKYVELIVREADGDMHSSLAPMVQNPAWRLVWALATLKDASGRVLIPGFSDAVRPPTEAEMQALHTLPNNDEADLRELGLRDYLDGVRGIERWRRLLFEPTCTICGLVSGYTGQGTKTVLPAEARAKIDFRLVPDMHPDTVVQQLRAHLDAHGFGDFEIIELSGERPARSDLNSSVVQAMVAAGEATYGVPAVVQPTMAGTGPMDIVCADVGTPVCSGAGCGHPGDQIHAPNENIHLADYWSAVEWMARFVHAFAAR